MDYQTAKYSELKKAALAGDAEAQFFMGRRNHLGGKKNYKLARFFYHAAIENNNNTRASNNLGLLYDNGQGGAVDRGHAVTLFRSAAEHGVMQGFFNLAVMYASRNNMRAAIKSFEGAAKLGSVLSMRRLSMTYYEGRFVKQDYKAAFDWAKKAAELGDAVSLHNLSFLYDKGLGCQADRQKASTLLLRSANKGLAESEYSLGIAYIHGALGQKSKDDYLLGEDLLMKAAKQGFPKAVNYFKQNVAFVRPWHHTDEITPQPKPGANVSPN